MTKVMDWFEQVVIYILIVLMMAIIVLGLSAFIIKLADEVSHPLSGLIDLDQILGLFGYVLLIVIGVELLDTIRAYLVDHVVHVEIVLEVALIAVARKVIILNIKETPSLALFGIASLVIALAGAYYLEKRGRKMRANSAKKATRE